jgi:hypothetical protein
VDKIGLVDYRPGQTCPGVADMRSIARNSRAVVAAALRVEGRRVMDCYQEPVVNHADSYVRMVSQI